ncbi:prolactin receptor [Bombina bombina]|uniref:prolactin receptor n=1 Tax=Bombina bombina TaxID=8345 RepID=UPI00235AA1D0|nr:prolactin receptor [Bombina bombina]
MQKRRATASLPFLLLVIFNTTFLDAQSPPGKPGEIKCRSHSKESFYCKWKPGSNGGLPTKHNLLYTKETDTTVHECPDYSTAGPNSCFFAKNHTSIWVYYHFTVKATNALGSNVSDVHSVDVAEIVEPFPPMNVSLSLDVNKSSVIVTWLPPAMADVKSGWLTLKYVVRIKEEKEQTWEDYPVEGKTTLTLFSLQRGGNYAVQVRCRPDHNGFWSDWTPESYIQIPGVNSKQLTLWVSVGVVSFILCLTVIWTIAIKGCSLMSCLLPPVPGPKIMGFDTKLLESGKTADFLSALDCHGFPPTSDCEELLVEFLEVDDSKEHLIASQEDDQKRTKASPADTDNDSGRGSCDSPFAFSEGIKDLRNPLPSFESADNNVHEHTLRNSTWPSQNVASEGSFSNFNDNKSYVWPDGSVFGNESQLSYNNITDVCKQIVGAPNLNFGAFLMPSVERNQPRYFKTIETIEEEKLSKENDLEYLSSKGIEQDTMHLLSNEKAPFKSARTMDYVEVHKVNQNNALALIPKHKDHNVRTDQYSAIPNKEYTKVERVEANNVLVLMQDMVIQANQLSNEQSKDYCKSLQPCQAEKHKGISMPARNEGKIQGGGMGYMDPSSFLPSFS